MILSFRRTLHPAILLGLAVLALPIAATPPAAAADETGEVTRALPPSNTALLARAAHAAARRLVAQVPLGQGMKVGLRQEGEGKLDADVREALLQAFNARKITCVLLDPVTGTGLAPGPGASDTAASGTPGAADPTGSGGLADLVAQAQQQAAGASDYDRLQAERAAQELRADSIRAAQGDGGAAAATAASADLPVLTWRVQEARVDYVRQFRSGLFGAHRIERRARADLALRMSPAGSDGVAWSASADTVLGDVVLKSEISALEDRTRPETRPTLPQSGLKKVVEPVLVIVLIAGLVSLFYQNRP